jgi:hypothetical protein
MLIISPAIFFNPFKKALFQVRRPPKFSHFGAIAKSSKTN